MKETHATSNPKTFKAELRAYLKGFPILVKMKHFIWDGTEGSTSHNMLRTFPLYAPHSAGRYKDRAALTVQTINQIFPFLASLSTTANGRLIRAQDIENLPNGDFDLKAASDLKILLDKYGSDKANLHNYHNLYGVILRDRNSVKNIFEIGLGTNNTDVVSHMGSSGRPGASLRAFRDYCENANVYGADVDKRVLFTENRIKTFYVDQTNPTTFTALSTSIPNDIDLMIDDGLHSPNANIESLRFGIGKVKIGGWVVIEDITSKAIPVWEVVAAILPKNFKSYIFKADGALVFAVERLR